MTLEEQVSALTSKVDAVLTAINIQKSYLDAASRSAIAGVTAQGAMVPTPAKSPLGNDRGVFDPAWLDPTLPIRTGVISAGKNSTDPVVELLQLSSVSGVAGPHGTAIKMGYPAAGYGTRIVSGGDPTMEFGGYTSFENGAGSYGYNEIARFTSSGAMLIGSKVTSGSETLQVTGTASVLSAAAEGAYLMKVGLAGASSSLILYAGNGQTYGQPQTVMYVGKNSNTDRGISCNGTVNTMGNDYAEYILKCPQCSDIAKGQIIGLTSDNMITDRWSDAVMFAIKSTEPSFVGGDTWAAKLGERPAPQAGPAPIQPPRLAARVEKQLVPGSNPSIFEEVMIPGDTDAEWVVKMTAYTAAVAIHAAAAQKDDDILAAYESALELERQKVDRIAIAGRVPVNVLGAKAGDYIVPAKQDQGIKGVAVAEKDITMEQYLRAVGRVIAIEPDGRAYAMVKAV